MILRMRLGFDTPLGLEMELSSFYQLAAAFAGLSC